MILSFCVLEFVLTPEIRVSPVAPLLSIGYNKYMNQFRFHPVISRWFEQKFGSPTEPQQRGWPAIQSGAHTLIAAPTGSGKTLAAFFAELDLLFKAGLAALVGGPLQRIGLSATQKPIELVARFLVGNGGSSQSGTENGQKVEGTREGTAIELGGFSKEFAVLSPSPPLEERAGERRP